MQRMEHRYRMRLGRIRAEEEQRLRVLLVVVRVSHRAIAPGLGDARDRRAVADARLVVGIVRAPEAYPLAEQFRLLVVVLRRADHEERIRPALLADLEELLGDLVVGLVPADALPLAPGELHRVLEAVRVLQDAVLADRGALPARRGQVARGIGPLL